MKTSIKKIVSALVGLGMGLANISSLAQAPEGFKSEGPFYVYFDSDSKCLPKEIFWDYNNGLRHIISDYEGDGLPDMKGTFIRPNRTVAGAFYKEKDLEKVWGDKVIVNEKGERVGLEHYFNGGIQQRFYLGADGIAERIMNEIDKSYKKNVKGRCLF